MVAVVLKCQWVTNPPHQCLFLVDTNVVSERLLVMSIEEMCQVKNCFVFLVNLQQPLQLCWSLCLFSGTDTETRCSHSYILTSLPANLWLTLLLFRAWKQAQCVQHHIDLNRWKNRDVWTNSKVWNEANFTRGCCYKFVAPWWKQKKTHTSISLVVFKDLCQGPLRIPPPPPFTVTVQC